MIGAWKWHDVQVPHGLVGEVAEWIHQSAIVPQPKFALAGALTVCGALLGRGVKDWTGQMTNLYTLAVGHTSAGKNDPLRCIQRLILALGRDVILSGEATSDTAVECLLLAFPSRLFLLDEVGHYLTSMKNAGQSNGHLKSVMPMLTKAWSAAQGALQGKARAPDTNGKLRPPRTIPAPCVSFYGTTAPDVLFEGMSGGDFADGSIPRFIPFISTDRPRTEPKPDIVVPPDLLARLDGALGNLGLSRDLYAADERGARRAFGQPVTFSETEEATEVFHDLEETKFANLTQADLGDVPLYLWGKATENARRVALTVAALAHPEAHEVQATDALFAASLIRLTVGEMVERVRADVATTKAERDKRVILRVMPKGEWVTRSDITRRTQSLSKHDREDALDDLVEAERIEKTEWRGTGDKSVTVYRKSE